VNGVREEEKQEIPGRCGGRRGPRVCGQPKKKDALRERKDKCEYFRGGGKKQPGVKKGKK